MLWQPFMQYLCFVYMCLFELLLEWLYQRLRPCLTSVVPPQTVACRHMCTAPPQTTALLRLKAISTLIAMHHVDPHATGYFFWWFKDNFQVAAINWNSVRGYAKFKAQNFWQSCQFARAYNTQLLPVTHTHAHNTFLSSSLNKFGQ